MTIHGAAPPQVHDEIAPPAQGANYSTSRSVTDTLGGNDSENPPDAQNATPGGASEDAEPPAPNEVAPGSLRLKPSPTLRWGMRWKATFHTSQTSLTMRLLNLRIREGHRSLIIGPMMRTCSQAQEFPRSHQLHMRRRGAALSGPCGGPR